MNRKLLIVALTFSSASAQAFTLGEQNLKGWDRKTLPIRYNATGCTISETAFRQAIEEAIDLWNSVPTSGLKLELAGTTTTDADAIEAGTQSDDGVAIACDTSFDDDLYGLGGFSSFNQVIVKGGLRMNAEAGTPGDIADASSERLASAIAHELGHTLGLGHTADERALMYYSIARTQLRLGEDDINGITYLYPREEPGKNKVFGCGTISTSGDGSGGGNGWITLALLFAFAYAATRSRRLPQPV